MPGFGELLRGHLSRLGLSTRAFGAQVQSAHSFIFHIMDGDRLPPLDRIEGWADALLLKGGERAEFIREAMLAHCPAAIREEFARMQMRLEKLERKK
jgi:hypothetical protein